MNKVCFALLAALWFTNASAQSEIFKGTKFGKGMVNHVAKDSSWSVKFAPRIQLLSSTKWSHNGDKFESGNTSFLIRRARFKFDGFAFSPKLKYKLELGISQRDMGGISRFTSSAPRIILDAVVKWNFHENFVLWAGQTKLPGNRERVISSANLQLVDRSLLNARFNIDRDIGVQLRHHIKFSKRFIVREIFSIAQGEGRNVVTGNLGGLQFTGRLEFLPFGNFKNKGDYLGSSLERESKPKLSAAISYDFNNNAVRSLSNRGVYMENDIGYYQTNITTIFVDAMFKYKGLSIMMEYAKREAADPIAKNSDGTETGVVVPEGNGINLSSGYLFPKNWEVTGRFSAIDLDNTDQNNQYTLGISKYIVGHKLKVQSDFSYLTLENISNQLMYRLQFELHF